MLLEDIKNIDEVFLEEKTKELMDEYTKAFDEKNINEEQYKILVRNLRDTLKEIEKNSNDLVKKSYALKSVNLVMTLTKFII